MVIVAVVVVLIRVGAFRHHGLNTDPWRDTIGLALFVPGLGFAIWARVNLGRDWGHADDAEARTGTGDKVPTAWFAIRSTRASSSRASTAVVASCCGPIAVVLAGIYFLYSARVEERYMGEQFPDTYPAYKRSTKNALAVPPLETREPKDSRL